MMKNGTRKKIDNTAKPESPDLRAEIEKRAHEIWLMRAADTETISIIGFEPSVN
jgi:hypothetical protein